MEFDKQINQFFRINRNDFNAFDRKAEKILRDVYENGKREGKKNALKLAAINIAGLAK